jgi:hypothetical protein
MARFDPLDICEQLKRLSESYKATRGEEHEKISADNRCCFGVLFYSQRPDCTATLVKPDSAF